MMITTFQKVHRFVPVKIPEKYQRLINLSLLKYKQIIVVINMEGNTENNRNTLKKTFYAGGL